MSHAVNELSDVELFRGYEEVFRANTPEKIKLVAGIKRRMLPFDNKTPETDDKKLEEIVALYCAIMELSDYPAQMASLIKKGAMENGILREDHEIDDAYKLLELEIDTMAEQYFSVKVLDLPSFFGTALFVAIRDDKYSTSVEAVKDLLKCLYWDSRVNRVWLHRIEYSSDVAKHFSRAWFDEQVAMRIERAKRNGW